MINLNINKNKIMTIVIEKAIKHGKEGMIKIKTNIKKEIKNIITIRNKNINKCR